METMVPEAVIGLGAVLLMVCYHAFLFYKVKTCRFHTTIGAIDHARRIWVLNILHEKARANQFAVQTLRNSIMEATLIATLAATLTAAVAAYMTFADRYGGIAATSREWPAKTKKDLVAGPAFLIACFMSAFVCSAQSVRFLNSLNFLLNAPASASGSGSGNGSGSGSTSGSSTGNGSGSCFGNASGSCFGNGSRFGSGSGAGNGSRFGSGNANSSRNRTSTNPDPDPHDSEDPDLWIGFDDDELASLLSRSSLLNTLASRLLYFGSCLLFWVLGSLPLFVFTLALLVALYSSDFLDPASSSSFLRH